MQRTALAYYPAGVGADPGMGGVPVGVDVIGIVRDDFMSAVKRVGGGEASALFVAHLADAASSSRELVALLDWLDATGGDLIALDVGLDTATRAGAHIARVLREVERWERKEQSGRPPRGRPGIAHHSPGLAHRIRTLRNAGESLQAIANVLNDDGVSTPRGGHHWRPSSVQAVLGYRRPGPPSAPDKHLPLPRRAPRRSVDQHGSALHSDTSSFEFWFGLLERYVQGNGTAMMAQSTVIDGLSLGKWCSKQRTLYGRGKLSDDCVERLEALPGWGWNHYEARWQHMLALLQRFVAREKTSIVPREHLEDGEPLGRWVKKQRDVYKGVHGGGRLTKTQIDELIALPGWTWDRGADKWDRAHRALVAFQSREGHIEVPAGHIENGVRLDAWITRQRQHFRMGRIQRQGDHVPRLEDVPGWKWSESYGERWNRHYAALVTFVEREGHARVPPKHVEENVTLGRWVSNQRRRYDSGWMLAHHPPRIALLEGLSGWTW